MLVDKTGAPTTYFWVEVINSKRQLRGELGHVVQIHVCRLVETWILISLLITGDHLGESVLQLSPPQRLALGKNGKVVTEARNDCFL